MSKSPPPRSADEIHEEASLWCARQRMQSPDKLDEASFQAWLDSDPRCRVVYARMQRTADQIAQVGAADAAPTLELTRRRRWIWAAPAAGLAAAAAWAFAILSPMGADEVSYRTAIAEIETVTLQDGSSATLGPASEIVVQFSRGERRVELASGEVFFDVESDPGRPFVVAAGDARVRVVGTEFDVRRGGDEVEVSVAEGVVRVRAGGLFANSSEAIVRAGHQAHVIERVAPFSSAPAPRITEISVSNAGAWREGHLAYLNAPLSQVIGDLNRYYEPGVELSEPSLGEFRLTASFRADDIESFLATLPQAGPVNVSRRRDGGVVIAPAARR